MHLATWQPQLTDDQETRRETLLAHLRVERSYYVLSIICVLSIFQDKKMKATVKSMKKSNVSFYVSSQLFSVQEIKDMRIDHHKFLLKTEHQ